MAERKNLVEPDPNDGAYLRVRKEDIEAYRATQQERQRGFAITEFPSTPRFLQREIGGAVRRGAHRPALSMEQLRTIRDRSKLFAPIHRARLHQIRRFCVPWKGDRTQVGIRVVHKDWDDRNVDPPDGFEKHIQDFERVLWRPSEDHGILTLGDALAPLEEDLLTLNRPAIEVMHSITNRNDVVQWRPIDGGLVWPTLMFVEHWWNKHDTLHGYSRANIRTEDAVDLLSHKLRIDLAGMDYALVRDGIAERWYPKGKLIVGPWQSRTDVTFAGYPPSALEEAIPYAAAFADAFEYTAAHLSKGIFLDYILGLPASMHPDDADAFVDYLQEIGQGAQNKGRIATIALPPGAENSLQRIPLQAEFQEMGFQSMISLVASLTASGIYRMHPSTIGLRGWEGGMGHSLNSGSQTEEIGLAQEEGLRSDLGHLVDRFLNELARRCHPDLRVHVNYADFDPQRHAAIIQSRTQTTMTVNEGRLAEANPPLGFWLTPERLANASDEELAHFSDNPYNHPMPICMQLISSKIQAQAQDRMMQQQAGQAAAGGDFTQWDDEPEAEAPQQDAPPMQKAAASTSTITLHLRGSSY